MHMLFRRNFQRHGFQTNIYACGVDLFNKPSGILGAGEFFLKIVKAKAIVDTLVQNAVKRRTGAGMGRCQGGFCGPRVLKILADELGKDPMEIVQDGSATWLLMEETKGGSGK